jgi:hypothetical protein
MRINGLNDKVQKHLVDMAVGTTEIFRREFSESDFILQYYAPNIIW